MTPLHAKPAKMKQEVFEGIVLAQTLRAELGLGELDPVPCMLRLAEERLALDVVLAPLSSGVSGFYLPAKPRPLIIVEQAQPPARQRFTLAHELGHHAFGHTAAPRIHAVELDEDALTTEAQAATEPPAPRRETANAREATAGEAAAAIAPAFPAHDPRHFKPRRAPNEEERAANAFAGELLVPHDGAKRLLPRWTGDSDLDLAVRLSAHYGASAPSAAVRLQALGAVDWRGAKRLWDRLASGDHYERYAALGLPEHDDELLRHARAGGGARCSDEARRAIAGMRAEFDALA